MCCITIHLTVKVLTNTAFAIYCTWLLHIQNKALYNKVFLYMFLNVHRSHPKFNSANYGSLVKQHL